MKYRLWWVPQLPMKPFIVPIESIEQGKWLLDVLADYDAFQFEENVKPDYSNAGGIEEWDEGEQEWLSVDEDDDA